MWPFKKKVRQRRLEVRKSIPSGRASYWRRFRQAGGVGSLLLAAGLAIAIILTDAIPPDPLPYRLGQYVPADIRARVPFKVPSQKLIGEREQRERSATPATFRLNEQLIDEMVTTLKSMPGRLKVTTQPKDIEPTLAKQFALKDPQTVRAWQDHAEGQEREQFLRQIEHLRRGLVNTCLVQDPEARFQREQRTASYVVLAHGDQLTRKPIGDLISLKETGKIVNRSAELLARVSPALRTSIGSYLLTVFSRSEPIYSYDQVKTQQDIDKRIRQIRLNPPSDEYIVDQILVYRDRSKAMKAGLATGLRSAELELLANEHREYVEFQRRSRPWQRRAAMVGRAIIILLITALLGLYVAHYQRRIVKNHWRGFALGCVLLGMLVLSKAIVFALELNVYSAVFAVLFATIIITIAYDQRFSLAMGGGLSVLIVVLLRQDLQMFLVLFFAVAGGVFQLREIRTRSKIMKTCAIVAALVLMVICALGMTGQEPWKFVLLDGAWAAGAALLAGMVAQVMMPLIESIFRIATSMTLLEWCDASKPLLKRLATEAPGTWNHCLQLGAMCEAAAEAIGAQGLLARVGAYYHDIGKINKPEYFVENQAGSPSKHDKLSPAMSLLIIVGHVKDGLEMAREYGLPPVLHDFITAHHGTTLVQYFYHAATEQRKDQSERPPEEVEFRYPGPKPRSKETGILMLADASESSVRAMPEPTPGRIEGQVHTMVSRRLMDGQLDDCEMTLREVHQVEAALVKSLCSIYHSRIAYPAPPGKEPSQAEQTPVSQKNSKAQQPAQQASDGPQA